jgi:hypothetical protein
MAAAMPWPTRATTHGRYRLGHKNIQHRSATEASISELCAAKCRDVRTWHGGCRRASALAGPAGPPRCGQRAAKGEVSRTARHRSPTGPCLAAPRLLAGLSTGIAWCAASSAPWPAWLRRARLPQRWPDRARLETADRLRPAARAHPARQSAALIPACSAARGGSCDDCSSPQV